jgi:hypothetical protein
VLFGIHGWLVVFALPRRRGWLRSIDFALDLYEKEARPQAEWMVDSQLVFIHLQVCRFRLIAMLCHV